MNLINREFDKLKVLEENGFNNRGEKLWKCICCCGKEKTVKTYNLTSGHTRSCGCIKKGKPRKDIIGQKFHSLIIRKFLHSDKYRESIYEYECDCGNIGEIRFQKIGKNKTCQKCKNKNIGEIRPDFWRQIKSNANNRNLTFDITPEMAWKKYLEQNGKCAISGIEIKFAKNLRCNRVKEQTASLDRINSNLPYVENNIQWVHKKINELKWNLSTEELIYWCKLILKNEELKNEQACCGSMPCRRDNSAPKCGQNENL